MLILKRHAGMHNLSAESTRGLGQMKPFSLWNRLSLATFPAQIEPKSLPYGWLFLCGDRKACKWKAQSDSGKNV